MSMRRGSIVLDIGSMGLAWVEGRGLWGLSHRGIEASGKVAWGGKAPLLSSRLSSLRRVWDGSSDACLCVSMIQRLRQDVSD